MRADQAGSAFLIITLVSLHKLVQNKKKGRGDFHACFNGKGIVILSIVILLFITNITQQKLTTQTIDVSAHSAILNG